MKKEKRRKLKYDVILFLMGTVLVVSCVCLDYLYQIPKGGADISKTYEHAVRYVNASVQTESPKVAITFDDGPNAQHTPRLLEELSKRGVKATFFLIGMNAKTNRELVLQMYQEGHLIGNHTYHHVEITKISNAEALQELQTTSDLIEEITGEGTEFMRPPFGLWQKGLEMELSIFPVMWTIDPLDWTTENTDEIVNKVVTEVKEDDIILLHDCYESSVDAAVRIIDILQKEGYEFV
ncbi:MAG: polysaccharide deacetylase family protein, partial [Lachnospiraceae bacterium]